MAFVHAFFATAFFATAFFGAALRTGAAFVAGALCFAATFFTDDVFFAVGFAAGAFFAAPTSSQRPWWAFPSSRRPSSSARSSSPTHAVLVGVDFSAAVFFAGAAFFADAAVLLLGAFFAADFFAEAFFVGVAFLAAVFFAGASPEAALDPRRCDHAARYRGRAAGQRPASGVRHLLSSRITAIRTPVCPSSSWLSNRREDMRPDMTTDNSPDRPEGR